MKKTYFVFIALAGLMVSALAFAEADKNDKNKGYYSSLHPNAALSAIAGLNPPTNITVINASHNIIYVSVPNTPINDVVYPRANDHIYNALGAFYTNVVLRNPAYSAFFNAVVCPEAIISVYDGPEVYYTKIDNC